MEENSFRKSLKSYFFSYPAFPDDENKSRLYRVLNLIILNYWLIFFIAIIILILSIHKEATAFVLILMAIFLLSIEFMKWRSFYITSQLLFISIWIIITIVYLLTGIPLNIFSLWYIPFIIGVSLLLGKRWSFIYTVLTLSLIFTHLLLNNAGYIIEPYFVVKWYTSFIIFFIGFIQTIPPINLMIKSLKESEDKYKILSEQLEEKVVERTNQLEEANKELELYAYSLSHDLRNPLELITGLTKIITEEYADGLPEPVEEMIKRVYSTSNKTNNLAKGLLQYFTLKNEKLNKENIDLNRIIEEIIENFSHEIIKYNFHIEIGTLPKLYCDTLLITQVWMNLISNAIKYTKFSPNPSIKIGYYSKNEIDIYFIKDNGVGFDMQKSKLLFKPFQRLHNNNQFEGTGIGLAFVYSIIEKHEGKIWFDSKIGEGTSFYFSLNNAEQNNFLNL